MVNPVFMTKSCEQFLVTFVYTYKIPRNLRNADTLSVSWIHNERVVEDLIKAGADVNATDKVSYYQSP